MSAFKKGDKAYALFRNGADSEVLPCTIVDWVCDGSSYAECLLRFAEYGQRVPYKLSKCCIFRDKAEAYERLISHLDSVRYAQVESFRKRCMRLDLKIAASRMELENIKQEENNGQQD